MTYTTTSQGFHQQLYVGLHGLRKAFVKPHVNLLQAKIEILVSFYDLMEKRTEICVTLRQQYLSFLHVNCKAK